jgi:hypothetical protein
MSPVSNAGLKEQKMAAPPIPAAGNHSEFPGEAAGTMDGDGAFAVEARLHNFHAAGKDDKERDVGVTDIEKNFAAVDVPDVPSALDARTQIFPTLTPSQIDRIRPQGHEFPKDKPTVAGKTAKIRERDKGDPIAASWPGCF